MSIPFSLNDLEYLDTSTGVSYTLRAPTDEIEIAIIEHKSTFPTDLKQLRQIFTSNEKEARRWINGTINIILCGWKTDNKKIKLPPFPEKEPSRQMRLDLKQKILAFWNKSTTFGADDQKK